ncbi:MAG: DUF2971 domain-containing protein [Thalassobaculum sp.]
MEDSIDSIQKIGRSVFDTYINNKNSAESQEPDIIWHYTSTEGLLGICETNEIWASNTNFLNDSSELKYGIRFFQNRINILIDESESFFIKTIGQKLVHHLENSAPDDTYVASFTRNPDLLSQWKGYGSTTGSFSIGFDTRKIEKSFSRVRYLETEHDEAWGFFKKYFLDFCEEMRMGNLTSEYSIDMAARFMKNTVELESTIIKHSAFSEESEYRIWSLESSLEAETRGLNLRNKNGALIPYFPINIENSLKCISKIIVGPHQNPEQQLIALQKYFQSKGADIEVELSSIPFLP